MLVAYTDKKELFILNSSIPRTTLHQLRKTKKFYCPQCNERLQFRIGTYKIPHFAHSPKSNCVNRFSEGESELHLLGKEQLFSFFHSVCLEAELEPYIDKIQQRPDLLVMYDGEQRFGIEFQCSPISIQKYEERNRGYKRENISPIWIPLTPTKIQQNGIQIISINYQYQQYILYNRKHPYLLTYNPSLKQFIYLSNLMHVHGNRFVAKVHAIPLLRQHFPFYRPKNISKIEFMRFMALYEGVKHNYLYSRVLISRNGVNDLLLRSVYELRLNLQQLPHYIGVPIRGSKVMKTFSIDWQVALFYFLHVFKQPLSTFKQYSIDYFIKWARLPETKEAFMAVMNYCFILEQLSVEHAHQRVEREDIIDVLHSHFLAI